MSAAICKITFVIALDNYFIVSNSAFSQIWSNSSLVQLHFDTKVTECMAFCKNFQVKFCSCQLFFAVCFTHGFIVMAEEYCWIIRQATGWMFPCSFLSSFWSGSTACFHSLTLEQSSTDDPTSAALQGRLFHPEDGDSCSKTSTIYQPTQWSILEEWHVKVLTQDWDLFFALIFKTEDWHMPNIAAYTHFSVMYHWFRSVKFSLSYMSNRGLIGIN